MKVRKYFPLGKAYGEAFCNRVTETEWLISNLQSNKHSLLIAPRRYGKSSLAEKAIADAKMPWVKINFHLCVTAQDVAELILSNAIKLIGQALGPVDKIINSVKKYAASLHPKLSFGHDLVSLELIPQEHANYAVVIAESLLLVEKLLQEKNQRAVMFLDEFQEITKIKKDTNLEGAIRTAAQEMQNLAIIFSGSIRSLLLEMFDDEARPLYKLCRKLKLERIDSVAYRKHINTIALKTWGKALVEEVFVKLMNLSNRHPYYVNYLCDVIWEECDKLPTVVQVEKAWAIVVDEEWSDAIKEIGALSLNQRKILRFIATQPANNISSHDTCVALALPSSTILTAVAVLIDGDYIELDEIKQYKIINPLLHSVLAEDFVI